MPSPVEIALSSLLPTTSYLPPELVSLCTSLLAQSRTKASSLKPEEEIGRTYACVHIACQRLGHKLALEVGKPAPPVNPKVYNKLVTYFNAVLKTTTTSRTVNGSRTNEEAPNGTAATSTRATTTAQTTPSKRKPVSATTAITQKRKEPPTPPTADADSANIPDSLKPTIRLICASYFDPESVPHVFAGLSSILTHLRTPQTPRRGAKRQRVSATSESIPTSIRDDQLTNMAIAVFTVVYCRVRGEWNVNEPEIAIRAHEALLRRDTGNPKAKFDWEKESATMDEVAYFKDSIREAWWDMEWIQNLPEPPETRKDMEHMTLEEMENLQIARGMPGVNKAAKRPVKTPLRQGNKSVRVGEVGAAGLMPGLGTMFQPAVDWLSEERRGEFERWRGRVLRDAEAAAVASASAS